ncbi:ABC transporter permease [Facklamia sp. P12937]|uniref:ABC transporter permease n=1 Tax=Facklamia sp. P12937 TaxID=3421949 RepID=UPI003D16BBAE
MPKISNKKVTHLFFYTFIIWLVITFIIYPISVVFTNSLLVGGNLDFSSIEKVLTSKRAMQSIKNSFVLAVSLAVSVNFLGVFLVLVTDYFEISGARFLKMGYMTTLLMGGIVMNFGYLLVYGKNGFLTKLLMEVLPNLDPYWFEGFGAVFFVMTFGTTHIYMLFLSSAIRSVDFNLIEAAKLMGSSPSYILKTVVLPTLKPVIITLTIMTFQTGLAAFSAPVMVGGKTFQTISPLILTFANRPASRDLASILSIFLGFTQIFLLYSMTRNEHRLRYLSLSKTQARLQKQKIQSSIWNAVIHVLAYLILIIYSLPLVALIIASFSKSQALRSANLSFSQLTLDNYVKVFSLSDNLQPIVTSIFYSLIAALAAVFLMAIVARKVHRGQLKFFTPLLEYVFYIPWLIPGLLLVVGYLMAYDRPSFLLGGHSVIGSWWILPITYMVVSLPNSLRYLKAAYYGLDNQLEDASVLLGASSGYTFRKIVLPVILPTILALIAIHFNRLVDDFDLSVFLYQPSQPTLGIVIRRNANADTNSDAQAINAVYSVFLMGIKGLALYFIYGRGNRLAEERRGK